MYSLGLSFFYHDSAACLVRDGVVVAAAQEERFSRRKHDAAFPAQAVDFCLREAGIKASDLDVISYYEKPYLKLDRILQGHFRSWPGSWREFLKMQDVWLGKKMRVRRQIKSRLFAKGPTLFFKHHQSHAASAFFASPFEEATVVTLDGVGEWATAAVHVGRGNRVRTLREIHFPHSLGLFYAALTGYLGFAINEDEYKVMGLASYGRPVFLEALRSALKVFPDGHFETDMSYFGYQEGSRMLNEEHFEALIGFPPRKAGEPLLPRHQDLAASAQALLEEAVLALCESAVKETGFRDLCLAGGVALNCSANAKLSRAPFVDRFFAFPAAGDAGAAVGAALLGYYHRSDAPRSFAEFPGVYLGPRFTADEVKAYLERARIPHRRLERRELVQETARALRDQKIVGWFQGAMEFGPRALGNRSLLADPTRAENWNRVNEKVKFREQFRPLAPSITAEAAPEFFDLKGDSPYMLLTATSKTDRLPAVTHVDGSSRVQTVTREQNPLYHELLTEFGTLSSVPALLNTSFNVAGMPIVCTPQNAFQCFSESDLDVLVMEDCLIERRDIPYLNRTVLA